MTLTINLLRFVQAPNTTLTDAWCNTNAKKPTAILPPHTAPLDGKLGVGTDSYMYVSLHGSWNRQPPTVREVNILDYPDTYVPHDRDIK